MYKKTNSMLDAIVSLCLFGCLFVYLFICLFVCLFVCLFTYQIYLLFLFLIFIEIEMPSSQSSFITNIIGVLSQAIFVIFVSHR